MFFLPSVHVKEKENKGPAYPKSPSSKTLGPRRLANKMMSNKQSFKFVQEFCDTNHYGITVILMKITIKILNLSSFNKS